MKKITLTTRLNKWGKTENKKLCWSKNDKHTYYFSNFNQLK